MRMYDILEKKAAGGILTDGEIHFFMDCLCAGTIPDYQVSALLMAIFIQGMSDEELAVWTDAMAHSGAMVDLSAIHGVKVDKHSTGGIGDKTTVILGPILAACGGRLAKMSGRGLGFSGGTIDKLESVPGFNTALTEAEFIGLANTVGVAITGQTEGVAVADKKLYALRDVTATVNSIPLIASSIMSKKLASGNDKILLDVKVGSGAFMKTVEEGRALAAAMVEIGRQNGKETVAILTNMNRPLGQCVGNLLEMQEAYEVLRGAGAPDLTELCLWLSAKMLSMVGLGTFEECRTRAENAIANGSAAAKFREFLTAQGGDFSVIEHPETHYPEPLCRHVTADAKGWFIIRSAEDIGKASVALGAGRLTKADPIDFTAGIVFDTAPGDAVYPGQPLCRLYAASEEKLDEAEEIFRRGIEIAAERPAEEPLILGVVDESNL